MDAGPTGDLGSLLRAQRGRAGLTQEDLAARAGGGLSARTLGRIEGGRTRPYRHTLEALATALGLGAEESRALLAAWRATPSGVRHAAPPGRAPEGAGPAVVLPRLPVPLTALIGREREEAGVAHLLRQPGVRLVTLTGPAGVGKTRLALQVAAGLGVGDAFADGVAWVDLAPLRDPALVLPAVTAALGLREEDGRPATDLLAAHLRDLRLLLALDNLEQVAEAGPALVALLGVCPGVAVLATSRAALRVRGEQLFAVPPLTLATLGPGVATGDVARAPAVALFAQRARAACPDFALDAANAADVAAICARLDGLPLALELAAARLALFSPRELLGRLDRRLEVLAGGARDLPERQRALRAALAWSHDLLEPAERALFRRLAVFASGCALGAVAAVCGAPVPAGLAATEDEALLTGVAALLDHSLLRRDDAAAGAGAAVGPGAGGPRVAMLETVREYAAERLAESGEGDAARRAHADYYLALAEAAAPHWQGAAPGTWVAALDRERDNLHAALTWMLGAGSDGLALAGRLAVALALLWRMTGRLAEGQGWLETVLARAGAPSEAREGQWEGNEGAPALTPTGRADLHCWAGWLALDRGDPAAAGHLAASAALARGLGDPVRLAHALTGLADGALARSGRERALGLYEEAGALAAGAGDQRCLAGVLLNRARMLLLERGDAAGANPLLEESLALSRRSGDETGVVYALFHLGLGALLQGDAGQAEGCFVAALRRAAEGRYQLMMVYGLEALGLVAGARGAARGAVRLFGAAAPPRAALGAPHGPEERALGARAMARARATLGAAAFAAAWAEGERLALEEAVAAALEGATSPVLRCAHCTCGSARGE